MWGENGDDHLPGEAASYHTVPGATDMHRPLPLSPAYFFSYFAPLAALLHIVENFTVIVILGIPC